MRGWFARTRRAPHFRPGDPGQELRLDPRIVPATLPAGFTATEVVNHLVAPTSMAFAPDGRLFITDQSGAVFVMKDGRLLPDSLLTVSVTVEGERGLSGIGVDPSFASNGYVYVYYTTPSGGIHNRLSRFTIAGDHAVPGSEKVLLDLPVVDAKSLPWHNGGGIHFGVDGKLYLAVGDHRKSDSAQDLNSPLGKILRLNPDGTIPADNPFFHRANGLGKAVYALGFRNPFTFAVQPETGRTFVNDVGERTWEEVDDLKAGGNYGWPRMEGNQGRGSFIRPLYTYRHGEGPGQGCAIVGGTFYPESPAFPETYHGAYFFADFCSGEIRMIDPATRQLSTFATGLPKFSTDLDVGPDGALYYLSRDGESLGGASIVRIAFATRQPPRIDEAPASQTTSIGRSATFSVSVSGTAPFSYQWQRDGRDVPGETGPTFTIPAVAATDTGATVRVLVTNAFGLATSNPATLTATTNQPPTALITQPSASLRWRLGQTIAYAGTAIDPEVGTLPASAFTWKVDLHHDAHTHPFMAPATGKKSGTFRIPNARHDAGRIWYRVELTVTDSGGLKATTFTDIYPRGNVTRPG